MSDGGPMLLEVRDLVKRFGGVTAVNGASLDVVRGSITSLIGPNGAGKTTAFNVIAGFYRPDRGSVRFDGARIEGRPPHRVARAGLVRTFQRARALDRMSVLDNMLLAGAGQPGERLWLSVIAPRRVRNAERRIHDRALELLDRFRLAHLADEYAGTLSGGQRKLLEFARALVPQPQLLLLDEPLAGVSPTLRQELLEHMRRLRDAGEVTFLLIEHDLEAVMRVSDEVLVMSEGRVIASGSPEDVRRDPRVVDAYLGTHAPDDVPASP